MHNVLQYPNTVSVPWEIAFHIEKVAADFVLCDSKEMSKSCHM